MNEHPWRNIISSEMLEPTVKSSTRSSIISIRWIHECKLTLECGHIVLRRDYGCPTKKVRCKECRGEA